MEAKLETNFTGNCNVYFEHDVCVGGYTYLLIFGHHINGGFISIPNWKICCEASNLPFNACYNTDKLTAAGLDNDVAAALAQYIDGWMTDHQQNLMKAMDIELKFGGLSLG